MYLLWILSIVTVVQAEKDPATDAILYYKENHTVPEGPVTTTNGAPVTYTDATNTLNTKLILNSYFMEMMSHLLRERIPERVAHAKGTGAFGYFEVTKNFSHICKADLFSEVGKKTPVAVRFSQTTSERGLIDLNRDVRGFAVKFYTKEGNFDIVGINMEMYFYKDPLYFQYFAHATRRNPATNLKDPKTFWDAIALHPESIYTFMSIFSDGGIPASYRTMPGYGNHLFQVENNDGKVSFVKFHFVPDAGIENLTSEEAKNISSSDPDWLSRDLFRAIANGNYPSWTLRVQVLSEDEVKTMGQRAIDVTRIIPKAKFPLQELGRLVLNRNPRNHFAEVEQLAYCPSHLVPGIKGGVDKLYEGRCLFYKDAHLYRLGPNANNILVNCPFRAKTRTYYRNGPPPVGSNGYDSPNYFPNSFNGPVPMMKTERSLIEIKESNKTDNFDQACEYYEGLDDDEKTRLVENLVENISEVNDDEIQQKIVGLFKTINAEFGERVCKGLELSTCCESV